jgi:hypothetical protein
MGYTHYWTQTRDLTEQEFGDFIGAARRIIQTAEGKPTDTAGGYHTEPVQICGGRGTGKPTLNKDELILNGNGPNLDHETFAINRVIDSDAWNFCKTARKPYDVVVTACLIVLAHDYGFEVSSDGDVEEWEAGEKLVAQALGKDYPNPLIVEQLVNA